MNIWEGYRAKVEDELKLCLRIPSTPLLDLNTMDCYHMGFCDRDGKPASGSKGKYLRPLFCVAMCAGLGGDPEQAIPAAAALELMHRTSLIFDDIQDKGVERNNRPTVWAIWGADQAINAGYALSSYARLALQRMTARNVPAETILKVMMVLENAVIDLCQGQFMDISFVDSVTVGVEDYLRMVGGKTGVLFAASCAVGAILALPDHDKVPAPPGIPEGKKFRYMRSKRNVSLAWEFGLNMGMAFQVHDDYLGVWGNEAMVGKTANDLIEKKRALPLILALQLDPKATKNWLDFRHPKPVHAAVFREWMEKKGIPRAVKAYEQDYIQNARENLNDLSLGSEWHGQFEKVLSFLSEREI